METCPTILICCGCGNELEDEAGYFPDGDPGNWLCSDCEADMDYIDFFMWESSND